MKRRWTATSVKKCKQGIAFSRPETNLHRIMLHKLAKTPVTRVSRRAILYFAICERLENTHLLPAQACVSTRTPAWERLNVPARK